MLLLPPPSPRRLIAGVEPPAGASASAWRSDVLMYAVTQLSKMAQGARESSSGRQIQLQPGDIPCGKACIKLPGDGPGAAMELTAIINPLSKEAQRFIPVMIALQQALGLTISLHLNPELKISEFPLENFYRCTPSLPSVLSPPYASGWSSYRMPHQCHAVRTC